MKRTLILWGLAVLLTLASAVYQRWTGPSYPVTAKIRFAGQDFKAKLERSHSSSSDYLLEIPASDTAVSAVVHWRRYKSNDEWSSAPMHRANGKLSIALPKQPPAGKLMYKIELVKNNASAFLPVEPVVMRFRGDVPAGILIPHVILMFAMMLLSTRTGLEAFNPVPRYKLFTCWTVALVIIGGLIFGPLTQLYAFGELWTGIPFGHDLTDNKTLIAFLVWAAALVAVFKSKKPVYWIVAAAIITLIVFLIPHSVLGSELDYTKVNGAH
jgi:hypothetical protein